MVFEFLRILYLKLYKIIQIFLRDYVYLVISDLNKLFLDRFNWKIFHHFSLVHHSRKQITGAGHCPIGLKNKHWKISPKNTIHCWVLIYTIILHEVAFTRTKIKYKWSTDIQDYFSGFNL